MADHLSTENQAPGGGASPSNASEQARLRKERREAKIRAGGSARLNKITGLGGGVSRDPPPQPASELHDDPEEVDISQHFYEPTSTPRINVGQAYNGSGMGGGKTQDEQLRDMMLGFPPGGPSSGGAAAGPSPNPFAGFPGMDGSAMGGPDADDPMMKLLQQMMGAAGGAAGGAPGAAGGMMGGMPSFPGMPGMPGMHGQAQEAATAADPYAYLWRIVHAVFALGLGLYIALTAEFTGTKFARDLSAVRSAGVGSDQQQSVRFFYIFATVEIILQTSRYFLEKGVVQPGGILGTVMGFLPQPWKGYLNVGLRYGRIWTTASTDAMVCIFVLGVCCWWRAM